MPFSIEKRIEFGDTDMAGIVHFSNFFRYMEIAETAFLRSFGMTVSWMEDGKRYGFPRVSANCDFKKPAMFEDVLNIAVTIEKMGTKSLSYRFDFTCNGAEVATGRVTSVFCRSKPDHGMESLVIPKEMRAKLSGV